MRIILYLNILFFFSGTLFAQEGHVERFVFQSEALKNSAGENSNPKVSVYLPPGYETSGKNYPVIYYLHGFTGTDSIYAPMKSILDQAIRKQKIRPFIFVQADHNTLFQGSFYSNSSFIGNYEDFQTSELVEYIDTHYRTLATKNSRGIAKHT